MQISSMTIQQAIVRFPEIALLTRDAHYLRGFFGNLFKEHSPLLHNHYEDGSLRYQYPLVQYKVLHNVPTLVGLGEGAVLLLQLFTQIKQLQLLNQTYPIYEKHITTTTPQVCTLPNQLCAYNLLTPWLALNQQNYPLYMQCVSVQQQSAMLQKIMVANIINFFKAAGYTMQHYLMLHPNFTPATTKFKNQTMIAFKGSFVCNAQLPPLIGLGKSVSRGFGTIEPC
ncbi:MAG TPA: CRISPR-associated endonuclease Cas6 [Chitinophagales bacterium]|nr:CRISPR-associated endonuclease Cas6 [Chitinophagales bacterium]HRK28434.1 CRISPR-associated endonuclease Cas6 [Chitinophagales bacterium]